MGSVHPLFDIVYGVTWSEIRKCQNIFEKGTHLKNINAKRSTKLELKPQPTGQRARGMNFSHRLKIWGSIQLDIENSVEYFY